MVMGQEASQKYFQKGQEAHRSNVPKNANPYLWKPEMANASSYWDQGWDSEQKAAYGED